MMMLKRWSGVSFLVALLFVLSMAVPVIAPATAQAQDEATNAAWKGVTLLYSSDVKGKYEPCG